MSVRLMSIVSVGFVLILICGLLRLRIVRVGIF